MIRVPTMQISVRLHEAPVSSTTRSQPLVSFASLTPNNLGTLPCLRRVNHAKYATGTVRKLNSVLFPIKYSEKFYHGIIQPEVEDFCKLGASVSSTIRVQDYMLTAGAQASLLQ